MQHLVEQGKITERTSTTSKVHTKHMTSSQVKRNRDSVNKNSIHKHSLQLVCFEHKMYMYMEQNGYH